MSLLSKLFGKAPDRAVEIESSGDHFNVPPGTTILERALAEGIAYPHDCTVGTCGSCRTRLISGKVEAITPFGYTLSREELEAGYILACQALPKTDLVIDVEIGDAAAVEVIRQPAALAGVTGLTHDIKEVILKVNKPIQDRKSTRLNSRH